MYSDLEAALYTTIVDTQSGHAVFPNELNLYHICKYIPESLQELLVGTGLDSSLDLFVNSQTTSCIILDFQRGVSALSRFFVEAAVYLYEKNQRYPDIKNDYIPLFHANNVLQLIHAITQRLPAYDDELLPKVLCRQNSRGRHVQEILITYLEEKSRQNFFSSWISEQKNLNKIIDARRSGNLCVCNADFTDQEAFKKIARFAHVSGKNVSLLYLSNIYNSIISNQYINPELLTKFIDNLRMLPSVEEALVIRSDHSSSLDRKFQHFSPNYLFTNENFTSISWLYVLQSWRKFEMESLKRTGSQDHFHPAALTMRINALLQGKNNTLSTPEKGIVLDL